MATLAHVERYFLEKGYRSAFSDAIREVFHAMSPFVKVAGVLDLLRDDEAKEEEQEIRRIVVGHTPDDNVRLLCDGTLLVRVFFILLANYFGH